jgi:hypothetical protein
LIRLRRGGRFVLLMREEFSPRRHGGTEKRGTEAKAGSQRIRGRRRKPEEGEVEVIGVGAAAIVVKQGVLRDVEPAARGDYSGCACTRGD